jgi:hypothetical protein
MYRTSPLHGIWHPRLPRPRAGLFIWQYLGENVAAADIELAAADIGRLDSALPPEAVAGERYNESMMAFVDR